MSDGPLLSNSPAEGQGQPQDSVLGRLRLVLWVQHQRYVALILLICLIFMTTYFVHHRYVNRGLIEIDLAEPLQADFKVDINQADWPEIVILPGVGKKLAQAIIKYRQATGPFESPESLLNVPGIGEKKLDRLRPYLLPVQSQRP